MFSFLFRQAEYLLLLCFLSGSEPFRKKEGLSPYHFFFPFLWFIYLFANFFTPCTLIWNIISFFSMCTLYCSKQKVPYTLVFDKYFMLGGKIEFPDKIKSIFRMKKYNRKLFHVISPEFFSRLLDVKNLSEFFAGIHLLSHEIIFITVF